MEFTQLDMKWNTAYACYHGIFLAYKVTLIMVDLAQRLTGLLHNIVLCYITRLNAAEHTPHVAVVISWKISERKVSLLLSLNSGLCKSKALCNICTHIHNVGIPIC